MKRMFSTYWMLAGLFLLFPINGIAQTDLQSSPAFQALVQRRDRGEVPANFVSEVEKEAGQLQAKGLPVEPYLLKANEGIAKRVPPKKIYPALKTSKQQTEIAGELFEKAAEKEGFQGNSKNREEGILRVQRELMTGKKPSKVEYLAEDYVRQKKVEKKPVAPKEEILTPKIKKPKQKRESSQNFDKQKVEKSQNFKIERERKPQSKGNDWKSNPRGNGNGRKK